MNEEIVKKINLIVDEAAPKLKELSKKIHDNPELGNEEFKACKWQQELLSEYGFEIEKEFCGIQTAYKATFKGKKTGPKLAALAEYDQMKLHPENYKRYDSFDDLMNEVLNA